MGGALKIPRRADALAALRARFLGYARNDNGRCILPPFGTSCHFPHNGGQREWVKRKRRTSLKGGQLRWNGGGLKLEIIKIKGFLLEAFLILVFMSFTSY